jgi:hypothetical protein
VSDLAAGSERLARLNAIAVAPAPADALDRVLDAALDVAPRAALFLVRKGRLRGWRCVGYEGDCARRLQRFELDPAATWLAPLLDPSAPRLVARAPGSHAPDFGQSAVDEALATSLRAGATTIALLVAERSLGQQPWRAVGLGTLGILGSLCLELDLVRRRGVAPVPGSEPESVTLAAAPAPAASLPPRRLEPETGLVPLDETDARPQPLPRARDARRFARLVAADIRLYNEDAVLSGRSQRDLAIRLEGALARGRESFLRRFPDLGPEGLAILEEAYVEVLAAGDAGLLRVP